MILRTFNHDEDLPDLLDRMMDNGIVVEPWAQVSLTEPGRVRLDRCVVVTDTYYDESSDDFPIAA